MYQEQARHLRRPDGTRIAYRIAEPRQPGEAPALLLIHGLASNLTRWSELVEQTSLTRTHSVIRLDLRGHGGSLTRHRTAWGRRSPYTSRPAFRSGLQGSG